MTDKNGDDLYVECGACGGGVRRSEAFHETRLYAMGGLSSRGRCSPFGTAYHPACAGVWRCSTCGEWNDKGKPCQGCGEKEGA